MDDGSEYQAPLPFQVSSKYKQNNNSWVVLHENIDLKLFNKLHYFIITFIIVTGNTFHIYIYTFQILLTNYKHTQPTLGLSVTFVFRIEYIYIYIYLIKRTYIHVLQNR